jgi:hypothetical protein
MIKISSRDVIRIHCDVCDTTLTMLEPVYPASDQPPLAVLDASDPRMRDAALHGLTCGKSPQAVEALRAALAAVRDGVAAS